MPQTSSQQSATLDHAELHCDLIERRRLLESASAYSDDHQVKDLLSAVDAALERTSNARFGFCDNCRAPDEAEILSSNPLARVCLECLSNSERRALEHDLSLASNIQAELLPDQDFETPDWSGHYAYQPHGAVSGDFCDVIADENGVLVLFGDISGKGVSAALLMSHLNAIFRGLAGSELSLVEMMEQANRMFCAASPTGTYATMVAARFEADGNVEISNAGHVPPLVLNGRVDQLPADGVPVGLFCDSVYSAQTLRLNPGDRLVLVTDGVIESTNGQDEEFGFDALARVVASAPQDGPRTLVRRLLTEIESFRGGSKAGDDTTLMVIRRES